MKGLTYIPRALTKDERIKLWNIDPCDPTGKQDKAGRPICEGDIVKGNNGLFQKYYPRKNRWNIFEKRIPYTTEYYVIFYPRKSCYCLNHISDQYGGISVDFRDYEVVGSIFDNEV